MEEAKRSSLASFPTVDPGAPDVPRAPVSVAPASLARFTPAVANVGQGSGRLMGWRLAGLSPPHVVKVPVGAGGPHPYVHPYNWRGSGPLYGLRGRECARQRAE